MQERQPAAQAAPAPPKKLPIRTIAVAAALMVLEAGAIIGFVAMTGRSPQDAAAALNGRDEAAGETTVEISLVDEKFQNMQTGTVWVWKLEVYLKVKRKNEEFVNAELSKRRAEIKEAIGNTVRRMQHGQLKEADLRTLHRQLTTLVNDKFGVDADGLPRVERVIIAKCEGFAT